MSIEEDLITISYKIGEKLKDPSLIRKLKKVCEKLISLGVRGLVKSNHSVMELLMAGYLIERGYDVDVEKELNDILVCDIYAWDKKNTLIVEVETGFVPPEYSLDPITYRMTRESSKVARYSKYSDIFGLATPPYHILQVPDLYFMPSDKRVEWGAEELKKYLDNYYKRPPISIEDIVNAKLDYVYVLIIDKLKVLEFTAGEYYSIFLEKPRINIGNYISYY